VRRNLIFRIIKDLNISFINIVKSNTKTYSTYYYKQTKKNAFQFALGAAWAENVSLPRGKRRDSRSFYSTLLHPTPLVLHPYSTHTPSILHLYSTSTSLVLLWKRRTSGVRAELSGVSLE
jgi:hypothetical protein